MNDWAQKNYRKPDGTEVRHGHTFQDWCDHVRMFVARDSGYKFGSSAIETILNRHPLWDYWTSGYSPEAAAGEMEA